MKCGVCTRSRLAQSTTFPSEMEDRSHQALGDRICLALARSALPRTRFGMLVLAEKFATRCLRRRLVPKRAISGLKRRQDKPPNVSHQGQKIDFSALAQVFGFACQ